LIDKKFQLKNKKRKTNNIHKKKIKVGIKIKLNQILSDEIEENKRVKTKYIAIKNLKIKFDMISK
jgi:hypothetical protein